VSVCYSPLRYPGGKQLLTHVLSHLIRVNEVEGGTYVEPYAGGAGAGLSLLFGEHVHKIVINDADRRIFSMWWAVLNRTDEFLQLLRDTRISMRQWEIQKEIYRTPGRRSRLELGFATFFLNRSNRSGILVNGGPIGGKKQTGGWGIDARFNKKDLAKKIERIALYSDRIQVHNLDGIQLLKNVIVPSTKTESVFVYLDPPYYVHGNRLYMSLDGHRDHEALRDYLKKAPFLWVLTYDNVPQIRRLYRDFRQVGFNIDYCAAERREGKEVMIIREGLVIPYSWARTIPEEYITTRERPMAMPLRLMSA
jgi:DNA adenine methylase